MILIVYKRSASFECQPSALSLAKATARLSDFAQLAMANLATRCAVTGKLVLSTDRWLAA